MADDRLSNEEAEQYDRQIRLWGVEAQKRLKGSRVLVVGMRGLGAEVCKDVVLAGIKSLTIIDTTPNDDITSCNRFLCTNGESTRGDAAVNRLSHLNPNVIIRSDSRDISNITEEYCKDYHMICITGTCYQSDLLRINDICHVNGIKFMCGDCWGYFGYFFTDLGDHSYTVDVPKEAEGTIELWSMTTSQGKKDIEYVTEEKTMSFVTLRDSLMHDWSMKDKKYYRRNPTLFFIIQILHSFHDEMNRYPHIDHVSDDQRLLLKLKEEMGARMGVASHVISEDFIKYCFSELSPVCAIVGGVFAQEIIKGLSGKDPPFQNYFFYDGTQGIGIVDNYTSKN